MGAPCLAMLCVFEMLYRRVHVAECQASLQGVRLAGDILIPDPSLHAIVRHLDCRRIVMTFWLVRSSHSPVATPIVLQSG